MRALRYIGLNHIKSSVQSPLFTKCLNYFSFFCDKIPWPKTTYGKEFIRFMVLEAESIMIGKHGSLALWSGCGSALCMFILGSLLAWQLEQEAESSHHQPQAQSRQKWCEAIEGSSKLLHYLTLSKQCHQVETMCSNAQDCGWHFWFNSLPQATPFCRKGF